MSEPDVVMYVQSCGFCGGVIERAELTAFRIPSRRHGNVEYNAHVDCVHRALHPSVHWIFDPDDARLHPEPTE